MKQFKVGQRVAWISNQDERGSVVDVGYAAITVKWDDGVHSVYNLRPAAEGSVEQLVSLKLVEP